MIGDVSLRIRRVATGDLLAVESTDVREIGAADFRILPGKFRYPLTFDGNVDRASLINGKRNCLLRFRRRCLKQQCKTGESE